MPRNVVTVVPRRTILPRRSARRERQEAALARLGELHRVRVRDDGGVEIDFPRALGRRAAKEHVISELASVEAGWWRLFRVYPTESAVRQSERGI